MKSTSAEKRLTNPEKIFRRRISLRLTPFGIFLISGCLACVILFWHQSWNFEQQEYVLGEPALRSYFSPISFTYTDQEKTDAARTERLKTVPPVYRVDHAMSTVVREKADRFFKTVEEVRGERRVTGETRWKELPFDVSKDTRNTFLFAADLENIRGQVLSVIDARLAAGVVAADTKKTLTDTGQSAVLSFSEETRQETMNQVKDLQDTEDAAREAAAALPIEITRKRDLRNAVTEVLQGVFSVNMVFDEGKTAELRKKTAAEVPSVNISIKKNELIVQRGMFVTEAIKQTLDQVHHKLATHKQQVQVLTGSFLVLLLFVLAAFYFSVFEVKIFRSVSLCLLFHSVVLFSLLLSKIVTMLPDVSIYLMPTSLAALLLTLLLHNRIGILGGIMMTVMSGFLAGFHVDVMFATLLGALAATFLAYRVRKRSHVLRIGAGIGAAYFLVITGYQLIQNAVWQDAVRFGALGFLNALFTAVASFLALPVLENLFDVITDVSLLELSDLNHPLIRRMMVKAPGTYHHSLIVSSLAENACERIGAHALLAKVGCYFHDIGKIEKPEFFAENQGHLYANQHEKLSPRISFEIISNHVKDGVRLAKRYHLRRAVVDFIREHQGTGVIYYFFKKAMDLATPNEHIRADDFRYPGPKPQSRETAIALLADSTEAASRSLKDPTPESIQQLVRKIINDKFIDGQLDECELTLQDLHKIQASFARNLVAIFHTRMKYPVMENPETAPDLFGANQFYKFRAED